MATIVSNDNQDSEQITEIDEDKSYSDLEGEQSTSSNSSNSCPFTPQVAEKISAAFAKATGIDIEVAIDLLNEHGWNIDQALAATYEAREHAQAMMMKSTDFKVLSWNLNLPDGDEAEWNDVIRQRAETIIDFLQRENAEIIFLQQVGTIALTLIIACLSSLYDDESIQIDPSKNSNYVSIFTRKSEMKKSNVSVVEYSNHCKMLKVEVLYDNSIHLDLFNTVIDNDSASNEIISFCFKQIAQTKMDHSVFTSISSEISENHWNSRPSTIEDLWEVTEKSLEHRNKTESEVSSTSVDDTRTNRPDRLFFRNSNSINYLFKPFQMKVEEVRNIPSTHYPVQGVFHLHH